MGPVARQGPREKLFAFGGFVTAWDVISAQGAAWKEGRKKAEDYYRVFHILHRLFHRSFPQQDIPVENRIG